MFSRNNTMLIKRAFQSIPKRNYVKLYDVCGSRLTPLKSTSRKFPILSSIQVRYASTQDTEAKVEPEIVENEIEKDDYHSIIKDTERAKGVSDDHKFEADTSKLLQIVAKSLYSDKEVFIRELISNASDSLEKYRYMQITTNEQDPQTGELEVHLAVDEDKKTFTIQDTGIGMSKEQLIKNLGTIARSGSAEFMKELSTDDTANAGVNKNLIGQFGVGFYSIFMVCDKVEVYSRSAEADSVGHIWKSDGIGSYSIAEAENVQRGTKIVLHLKGDSYEYSQENTIRDIIKKYSNFVGVPIYLNGKMINTIQALWAMDTKDITEDMHDEFYRFISNSFDKPRYRLQYKADAPLNIRSLFYVPEYKPTLYDMSRETDVSVTLYSRKVMILSKANHVLPKWLRFVKGVVDSEDIPLNLSRELLQDSSLIRKLKIVLTNRLLKFFIDKSKKDPENYRKFYEDYALFIREGIVTTPEQDTREEIAKLLRFESSAEEPGKQIGLSDYTSRMTSGSSNVYYLSAPSRILAEASPYMEAIKSRNLEVLYCYEPYDELVLMNLAQFAGKTLKSIENETVEPSSEVGEANKQDVETLDESVATDKLTKEEGEDLMSWLSVTLGTKIKNAKMTDRLDSHPCLLTVAEMGAARHFLKTSLAGKSDEERFQILQPTLELNPKHAIVRKLYTLKSSDPELAKLVADQIYDNALIAAGLIDDPRTMLARLNAILTQALEKH